MILCHTLYLPAGWFAEMRFEMRDMAARAAGLGAGD